MRVVLWNLAWLLIGPGTLAIAVFGTDAAYRASVPEPTLQSFGDSEQAFTAWELASKAWHDSKETLVWQVLIGTAVFDVILYFLVRYLLAARDQAKQSQHVRKHSEPFYGLLLSRGRTVSAAE